MGERHKQRSCQHTLARQKSTKKPYHELAVHVEGVLPVAELEGLQALAVQQAGSALLNHKRRVWLSSFYVYQTGSGFLILNPTKNIVQQAGSALLDHRNKGLIVVFLYLSNWKWVSHSKSYKEYCLTGMQAPPSWTTKRRVWLSSFYVGHTGSGFPILIPIKNIVFVSHLASPCHCLWSAL